MKPYEIINALGACSLLLGAFLLLSFFGGQISKGSASWESLVGGAGALLLGLLFCILADLGRRLVRIEERLSGRDDSGSDESFDE